MTISYCKTPGSVGCGLQVNKTLVAWIYPVGFDPIRFEVLDETAGPKMSEQFETLAGADAKMWEIARHAQARQRNQAAT